MSRGAVAFQLPVGDCGAWLESLSGLKTAACGLGMHGAQVDRSEPRPDDFRADLPSRWVHLQEAELRDYFRFDDRMGVRLRFRQVILPPRHRNPYSSHVSYLAQTRKTTPVMFNSGECILPAALGSTLKSAVTRTIWVAMK
jgi:hypothetical protein